MEIWPPWLQPDGYVINFEERIEKKMLFDVSSLNCINWLLVWYIVVCEITHTENGGHREIESCVEAVETAQH